MADVRDTLINDDFFGNVADTPKEGIEQHKKREELTSVIDKGKVHLLGDKWTYRRKDETINKTRQATKLLTKRTLNTSSMN